ncbi:hypothetical protein C462_05405 [Halorubrum distributum JCM 13916]|uniref:Uncharacterized protein n=1 Tax=Halorubrum distributum JCM 13916 TaxID=1230455 RepID=M0PNX1_9EURY|nr:hypothetical protein C462_05405 [Halorubrum arcis JCM 13916]
MPVDDDADDSSTDSDDNTSSNSNNETSSIKLQSHDLTVHINSTEDLEKMSCIADYHMRQMQRAALIGEYEVLEEGGEGLFEILGGR